MWKRMGASAACMCVLTTSVHGGGGAPMHPSSWKALKQESGLPNSPAKCVCLGKEVGTAGEGVRDRFFRPVEGT